MFCSYRVLSLAALLFALAAAPGALAQTYPAPEGKYSRTVGNQTVGWYEFERYSESGGWWYEYDNPDFIGPPIGSGRFTWDPTIGQGGGDYPNAGTLTGPHGSHFYSNWQSTPQGLVHESDFNYLGP